MTERSKNVQYLLGIDHLRGFAAILIVVYHGDQLFRSQAFARVGAWPKALDPVTALVFEGHTAVALFMVLSGFIFARAAAEHDVEYMPFLKNRFLRTYPLFLVLLTVGVCAYPNAVDLPRLLNTVFGLASFQTGSLQLQPFSGMFWTIAVEWQFYVLFPFLIRFLKPRVLLNASVLVAMAMICRWLAHLNGADARELSYWTILGRIDQFLAGIVAGYYFPRVSQRTGRWLFLPAAVLVLGSLFQFNHFGGWPVNSAFRLIWTTWEGIFWAFFSTTYMCVAGLIPKRLSAMVCSVGVASYSIYLWHYPFVYTAAKQGWAFRILTNPSGNALLNTLCVVLPPLLLFSALSYRYIEQPFMRLRGRYVSPRAPSASQGGQH